ncbi:heat shock protein 70 [Choiromyces venosus 120613-1]|uniref:Heat shock protein 70 n=1 Tax=Choiromyces venosus 120613-1 TaxID=1336337 RepID=A0A3N4J740_9PEZI|nr:heat shock protein 70 [Choiromyces venosus 120613-1]
MSVVGVDLGVLNTVIAVARNRGVDVITNEVSNRATPSMVGFGPKSRYLGEAAKTQEISNLKNTVSGLKRLAGRRFGEPELDIERQFISADLVEAKGGEVGARVKYLGQDEIFTGTQLIAMFLSKVRQTASAELKLPVSDVVLSVPPWFTDAQRRSIMDAAEIAGLKLLRLMNDTTATALGYGITKTDLPTGDEKPRRVAFIDIGHSNYTCSIVAFKKGELTVLSTAYDRHFGGRNFDRALIDHFAKEFKEKYRIDVYANPKAYFRVAAGVEKLKKILSANAQSVLNIESVMNDVDASSTLKREELEELVKPLLDRVTVPLEQALADAGLSTSDIDAIELVGGCTRVPSLKDKIAEFFGKPLSFTLNQDEAVARGCAFACAILSPVFKVRDFSVHDIVSYPIEFTWEQSNDIPDEDTSLTVFNKNNAVPSTKILTFYRKDPFDLEAKYAEPNKLPGLMSPWIGRFSVKGVKPDSKNDFMICKLKARVNLHGVLNVESGYWVEEVEVEEEIKEEGDVSLTIPSQTNALQSSPSIDFEETRDLSSRQHYPSAASGGPSPPRKRVKMADDPLLTEQQAMETDENVKPKTRKVKKQVKGGDLQVLSTTATIDHTIKTIYMERESEMVMEDKLVADTEDRKNALEEYIYELRGKLDDIYSELASEDEKSRLRSILDDVETWLYEEGEDTSKAVYTSRIEELRAHAGPIAQRYFDKEEEKRQAEMARQHEDYAMRKAQEDLAKRREGGDNDRMDTDKA